MNDAPLLLPEINLPDFPEFSFSSLPVISPNIVWVLLLVTFVVTVIISIILVFHWVKYSTDAKRQTGVTVAYFIGAGALFFGMVLSATYYALS